MLAPKKMISLTKFVKILSKNRLSYRWLLQFQSQLFDGRFSLCPIWAVDCRWTFGLYYIFPYLCIHIIIRLSMKKNYEPREARIIGEIVWIFFLVNGRRRQLLLWRVVIVAARPGDRLEIGICYIHLRIFPTIFLPKQSLGWFIA